MTGNEELDQAARAFGESSDNFCRDAELGFIAGAEWALERAAATPVAPEHRCWTLDDLLQARSLHEYDAGGHRFPSGGRPPCRGCLAMALLGRSIQPPAPDPVVAPDLDAAWDAVFEAVQEDVRAHLVVAQFRHKIEAAVTAQAEARIADIAARLWPFGVKFTGAHGVMTHGSMCYVGDGDSLDLDGWNRLSEALLDLRAAATPTQEDNR